MDKNIIPPDLLSANTISFLGIAALSALATMLMRGTSPHLMASYSVYRGRQQRRLVAIVLYVLAAIAFVLAVMCHILTSPPQ